MVLNQLVGGDGYSWIIWLVFMFVFFFFYPRIMISQIMWKLEKTAKELENMSAKSRKFLIKEISSKPTKVIKDSVGRFFDFFVIEPVSLDPYGIVKKLDHIVQTQRERFHMFVDEIAPDSDKEKKANLEMGLSAGITLNEIAKIVRHYVELVRKTKSFQIAMILQMQMPLVEKIAKAMYKGTHALAKGEPIGDSMGPYVAAKLIGNARLEEIAEDIVMAKVSIDKKEVYVMKAIGPGGRLGRPGIAVENLMKKVKVSRIITIDAAAKLEGEKTGSVAEGVGVAIGGPGVERFYIEDYVVKYKIPIDSIIVKMSAEEAIMPLRKSMIDAYPQVFESLERSLKRTKANEKVIVIGVGNTSGIGNSAKDAEKTEKWVNEYENKIKQEKGKKKKKDDSSQEEM